MPFVFSMDETCEVGHDAGTPVTPDYPLHDNHFNGAINWVEIALNADPDRTDPAEGSRGATT